MKLWPPVRHIPIPSDRAARESTLLSEWLVTNGAGGYASGTISGIATRRYHGLLIAALPAPLGRHLLVSHLSERVRDDHGSSISLNRETSHPEEDGFDLPHLSEFVLEAGMPVWRHTLPSGTIEKRLVMPHEQNTLIVLYRWTGCDRVRLKLLPSIHSRSHDAPVDTPLPGDFWLRETRGRFEVATVAELPTLRFQLLGARGAFTIEQRRLPRIWYMLEAQRGYPAMGTLYSPGYFRVDLVPGETAALRISTEPWEILEAMAPEEALETELERRRRRLLAAGDLAGDAFAAELVLAADQFAVRPAGRRGEEARMHAAGEEPRTIIAGYPWFTDWGRDTMISLEGLCLTTGRGQEAASILRTFSHAIRDGLVPNLFPEGAEDGLYHTADATLWLFHAVHRHHQRTQDHALVAELLPKLIDVVDHHLRGTRFGIAADPQDMLLRQGKDGFQLTWMDAKVGDWVVTPRRGKAVEINALWYQALRLISDWIARFSPDVGAASYADHAARVKESFNHRFWYAKGNHLFDVVDGESGDDPALRPNQIFALALPHPVLARERWSAVLETVERHLLTPVGLRTLSPDEPDYKATYTGDVRARDAAYHQGTVWPWLLGPFVDAWLRVHPGQEERAKKYVSAFSEHLGRAGMGSISEIFDAEPPFKARGCFAQAWSVAEVLRVWERTHRSGPP